MSVERFVTAQLCLDTAIHIGTGKAGEATDAAVRRTGDGRLIIPGRALGGSLRTLATRLAPRLGFAPCQALVAPGKRDAEKPCGCPVCQLFGDVHPVDENASNKSKASRLWVYDAFANGDEQPTYVRDGVGIDRRTGAAARNVKFDYETAPPQTCFDFKLRWTTDDEDTNMLLVAALAEWQAGRGRIGGNVARGLGRFHLQELAYSHTAIADAEALIQYLLADHPVEKSQSLAGWADEKLKQAQQKVQQPPNSVKEKQAEGVAAAFLVVDFTLAFKDLFLINDPLAGLISGFDHAPLLQLLGAPGQPGLPLLSGSSLRGVLRSHGEKIARTLATNHWYQHDPKTAGANFLAHCPACNVLAGKENDPLEACDSRLQGVIPDYQETPEEALCLSCQLFGSQRRGSRLWVRDAYFLTESLTEKDWKVQDFLAIDRFTGGGLDGAKFDAAPLQQARFQGQIVLHDPQSWELGWLALLLRDLAEGWITVGFGRAKGYGRLHAQDFTWTVGYLTEEDHALFPPLAAAAENQPGFYYVSINKGDGWMPGGWGDKAKNWVGAFNTAVTSTHHGAKWQGFERDSFFETEGENRLLAQYGVARAEVIDHE